MKLDQIDAVLTKEAKNFVRSSSFLEIVYSLEGEITSKKNVRSIISLYIAQVGLSLSASVELELGVCMGGFTPNTEALMEKHKDVNNWNGTLEISPNNAEALLITFLCFICPLSVYHIKKIFSF